MIIKKFLAGTEQDAIEMAKQELGSNAVVMNIKKIRPKGLAKIFMRSKVEVTAAVDEEPASSVQQGNEQGKAGVSGIKDDLFVNVPPMPEKRDEEKNLQDKIEKLESLLAKQLNKQDDMSGYRTTETEDMPVARAVPKDEERAAACKELIHKQLLMNEVDEEIADSIIRAVEQSLPANAGVDQILTSVYQKIILMLEQPYLIEIPEKSSSTRFVFFLGTTGVGKTTTIAKIASMLKLEKKANIALVTADTYRIAAVEQLKTYANILSVPLEVIYSPEELGNSLEELNQYDVCLVDTAGCSHRDKNQVDGIRQLIEQVPIRSRQVYLVLNSGAKYNDLKEIAKVYSDMTDFSIIFTKLDETSSAGAILNMHVKTKCPLSYVTWGQNVPDDIGEFDPQKIAKKLLGDNVKN
jgi:flagellar biosynthesis protein FlhF